MNERQHLSALTCFYDRDLLFGDKEKTSQGNQTNSRVPDLHPCNIVAHHNLLHY